MLSFKNLLTLFPILQIITWQRSIRFCMSVALRLKHMKTSNDWFCGPLTNYDSPPLMEPPVDVEPLEESDVREKRQSDEGCGQPEFEQVRKKILKKTRRKKSISKENNKRLKVKTEFISLEESCMDNGEETNYESEDISPTDELVQPVSNNCILNEILSEKKRALLECPEMIEFLQSRIRTS